MIDFRRMLGVGTVEKFREAGANGCDLAFDRIAYEFLADAGASECAHDLARRDPSEVKLSVELHGHLPRDGRIDGGADHILVRSEARSAYMVEDLKILAMRVAIADKKIEDDPVNERKNVGSRQSEPLQEPCAIRQRRPPLILVLDFRPAFQQLTEILLMNANNQTALQFPVVSRRNIVVFAADADDFTGCRVESAKS